MNRGIVQVTVTTLIRCEDGSCFRAVKMVEPGNAIFASLENAGDLGTYVRLNAGADWQWMGRVEKVSTPEQADSDVRTIAREELRDELRRAA